MSQNTIDKEIAMSLIRPSQREYKIASSGEDSLRGFIMISNAEITGSALLRSPG